MSSLRSDLARRIRARSTYIFGWSVKVSLRETDEDRLRLITHNPRNKRQTAEEVITVDMEEYARVCQDEDDRDIFIDRIIRSFLYPVHPLEPID